MPGKRQSGYNRSLFVHTAVKFTECTVVGFVLFVRLFRDVVSVSDYTALNGGIINGWEKMWKGLS